MRGQRWWGCQRVAGRLAGQGHPDGARGRGEAQAVEEGLADGGETAAAALVEV